MLTVEFQEARLVWSRRVEHQMPETETDIVTDQLDVLVGVAGHDPSTSGAFQRPAVTDCSKACAGLALTARPGLVTPLP